MKSKICAFTVLFVSHFTYASLCSWLVTKSGSVKDSITERVSNVTLPTADLSSLQNVKTKVLELLEESTNQCTKGIGATVKFCGHATIHAIPISYRVINFDPTLENIRTEITYPLAQMLVKMKSDEISKSDAEKVYFNFLLFWPELILKLQKVIPQATVEVGFSAITGLMTATEKNNPGVLSEIRKEVQKAIIKKFWQNLKSNEANKDLSFVGRIKFATEQAMNWDSQPELQEIANGLIQEMGLDRLKEALNLYRNNE